MILVISKKCKIQQVCKKVREGELRRLKCTALSGNPLPSLHWFAGGKIVEEGVTRFGHADAYDDDDDAGCNDSIINQ